MAKVAPRANAEVLPHAGRIISHPRIRSPSISKKIQQPGDENVDPSGRAAGVAPRGNLTISPHSGG